MNHVRQLMGYAWGPAARVPRWWALWLRMVAAWGAVVAQVLVCSMLAGPAQAALSGNALLSSLSLSAGTLSPTFASTVQAYVVIVPHATNTLSVTPVAADSLATVRVNGTLVASGAASPALALAVGSNTVSVLVTAQNGSTRAYNLSVSRLSNVATLSTLTLSAGTLSPAFESSRTSYAMSVPGTTTSLRLTPTATDARATVRVNGVAVASGTASSPVALALGSNTVTVQVTAQDGTQMTYTVGIQRLSSVATLSGLGVSAGSLVPAFASGVQSYALTVPNATGSLSLTPTATDSLATVQVNGVAVPSGSATPALALAEGLNTLNILVSAQDGSSRTYVVEVTRAASEPPATDGDVPLPAWMLMALGAALCGVVVRRR